MNCTPCKKWLYKNESKPTIFDEKYVCKSCLIYELIKKLEDKTLFDL